MIFGILFMGIGAILSPATSFENLQPVFNTEISAFSSIIPVVAIAPWAFVGFDNIPQAAEEFNFSPKKAFILIILSLLCAGLLYMVMITATALYMPWEQLTSSHPQWGTGDAMSGLFGNVGIVILALALTMGVSTGLNGFFVSSSRLLICNGPCPDNTTRLCQAASEI